MSDDAQRPQTEELDLASLTFDECGPWECGGQVVRGFESVFDDEWNVFPALGESGPVAVVSSEARARLIASAPQLLAEVKALRAGREELRQLVCKALYRLEEIDSTRAHQAFGWTMIGTDAGEAWNALRVALGIEVKRDENGFLQFLSAPSHA